MFCAACNGNNLSWRFLENWRCNRCGHVGAVSRWPQPELENKYMSVRPNLIEVGDIVRVDFNCSQWTQHHKAKVLWVPSATGDSWVFQDVDSPGKVSYISEGCTIVLVEKGK